MEDVGNALAVESLSMYLDAGESETIILAKEKDCLLIIDDGDGRKAATNMKNGWYFAKGRQGR